MATVQTQGEDSRRAVKWISDAEYLRNFFKK